jgi:hypothetical protein
MQLDHLTPGAAFRGTLPNAAVTVVSVERNGTDALTLTYRDSAARVADEIRYRHVEQLTHPITAVYEAMLLLQPLRFLLADDLSACKTIMAGLLIKDLIARGDLKCCLILCPGSLPEQWQDELSKKFHLPFEILTSDQFESARTGNRFLEHDLVVARLDKLSRNEDGQQKLAAPNNRYDLVVCDEAHELTTTFFGGEVKYAKRYQLGQLASWLTRQFLLMTATPHNGKEEDFQLFLALLDGDRFEGKFRDGVHEVDTTYLMRRMVTENLLKFDGTPLFSERDAHGMVRDEASRKGPYTEITDHLPYALRFNDSSPPRKDGDLHWQWSEATWTTRKGSQRVNAEAFFNSASRRRSTPTSPRCSTSSITSPRRAWPASSSPMAACPPTSPATALREAHHQSQRRNRRACQGNATSAKPSSRPTSWTAWPPSPASSSTARKSPSASGSSRKAKPLTPNAAYATGKGWIINWLSPHEATQNQNLRTTR